MWLRIAQTPNNKVDEMWFFVYRILDYFSCMVSQDVNFNETPRIWMPGFFLKEIFKSLQKIQAFKQLLPLNLNFNLPSIYFIGRRNQLQAQKYKSCTNPNWDALVVNYSIIQHKLAISPILVPTFRSEMVFVINIYWLNKY